MDLTSLDRAIQALIITDVFPCALKIELAEDYHPKYSDDAAQLQIRYGTSKLQSYNLDNKEDPSAASLSMIRFNIETGVRLIRPRKVADEEGDEHQIFATIEATFCAEYRSTESIDSEALNEFGQKNALYHVWPYWRELVHTEMMRFRLPPLVLPMFRLPRDRRQETAPDSRLTSEAATLD